MVKVFGLDGGKKFSFSERKIVKIATSPSESSDEPAHANLSDASTLEFLAFTLGSEEYGVDIQKIQELRNYEHVTHIANSPNFVKGVINLRGVIVSIIDMRLKFNLSTPAYNQFTVVIILNVNGHITGMVVDSVSDVITLTPDQIKPAPKMGTAVDADYLIGLATLDQRMLILVDIDKLMQY